MFTSNRTGNSQLWEVSAEGGEARRLRDNEATEYQADVSPDGKTLAFLSNLDGPERLLLQDLETGAVRELVRHGDDTIFGNPHWSPDGRFITYSSNWRIGHQIYVVEVATGKERRISGLTGRRLRAALQPRRAQGGLRQPAPPRGRRPGWSSTTSRRGRSAPSSRGPPSTTTLSYSPDGTELAFASNITGEYAIYRQRLSDGQAWRVTFGPGPARYPDYRPVR